MTKQEKLKRLMGKIKIHRQSKDISKYELAKRMSVSPGQVTAWEEGATVPGADTLLEIIDLIGYRIGKL